MITTNAPTAPVTRTVEVVTRHAMAAGLRPYTSLRNGGPGRPVYRGQLMLVVNGSGHDSVFGAIFIGARSGKVLRSTLRFGNDGPTRRYVGPRDVLAALRSLASNVPGRCQCPECHGSTPAAA
jgi:hypothetical protein